MSEEISNNSLSLVFIHFLHKPVSPNPVAIHTPYNTDMLTSWSSVLLEPLTVAELVKKVAVFYETSRIILRFRRASCCNPPQRQFRPAHTPAPCFFETRISIILLSSSRSPWGLFPSIFSEHNLKCVCNFPYPCYMSQPLHLSHFITLSMIGEDIW
jgi:hypothetical protein